MNVRLLLLLLLVSVGKTAARDANALRASVPEDSRGEDCDNWEAALFVWDAKGKYEDAAWEGRGGTEGKDGGEGRRLTLVEPGTSRLPALPYCWRTSTWSSWRYWRGGCVVCSGSVRWSQARGCGGARLMMLDSSCNCFTFAAHQTHANTQPTTHTQGQEQGLRCASVTRWGQELLCLRA